jgi:peptidyl-prolyl cis-trans isomerase-like protein 2
MANSGPRSNTSQFFILFRAADHLDGKHTVFGKLVGGESVLDKIERIAPNPTTDRPVKPITITGIQVLTDPFDEYKKRLAAKLERQDQSEDALRKREERQAERDKDRTTWLGTDLGERGMARDELDRKRRREEEGGVGKYLGPGAGPVPAAASVAAVAKKSQVAARVGNVAVPSVGEFGGEKKKRKQGGFGDFSGW